MANLNPLLPGDVPYPQYSVVTTVPLAVGSNYFKGRVYTMNAAGQIAAGGTDFSAGLFQVMADTTSIAVAGDEIQVLGPRSRMILIANEDDLHVGDDVLGADDSNLVIGGVKSSALYIGKIFEIYTKDDPTGNTKLLTAIGDSVIVETVQA